MCSSGEEATGFCRGVWAVRFELGLKMGRAPCCSKVGLNRGAWSAEEDALLVKYIQANGEGNWRSLPKKAGLRRCGKSCRLRWLNYLRPSIKRGNITPDEEELIIRMHALLGNRWAIIAGRVPGRTDNEIKNYWNTNLSKRLASKGNDPKTHKITSDDEKSNKKKYSGTSQQETKSKQKVQVPQVIAPNVYNPKADLKIHGLKEHEHGALSLVSMHSPNTSLPPSDAMLHENIALNEALNVEPLHQLTNEKLLLESHVNAHNSIESGGADDDNDEIGDMFRCILDFGREKEIPARHNDGWLQNEQEAAMEYQEELHWDDGALKQVEAEEDLGTDICVNDMAAMWEPCWWY